MKLKQNTGLFVLLCSVFFLRCIPLEMADLVDPTEARYASVAQEMLLSKDWLTPLLPLPEGVTPYLGKPPLHFWLTLISYKLFGVDEWTARLPSIIASMLIVFTFFYFLKYHSSFKERTTASLLLFSSPVFFFFSGASVVDVTLTACTTAALSFLFLFLEQESPKYNIKHAILAAIATAGGFLTKGPVALVLIGAPILIFLLFRKEIYKLKKIPWVICSAIFLLITTPWFILSEIHSPGFLKYFFWNENIARYLLKNYGDKYGSGHRYPRGMSLLLFSVGSITIIAMLGAWVRKFSFKSFKSIIYSDKIAIFSLIAALTPPVFFAFVKQMHIGYVLPGIPWLAIFATRILFANENQTIFNSTNIFKFIIGVLGIILFIGFGIVEFTNASLILSFLILFFLIAVLLKKIPKDLEPQRVLFCFSVLFSLFIVAASPKVNLTKSTEEILITLSQELKSQKTAMNIGIYTENTFSHYWISKNVENELPSETPINMVYVKPKSEVPLDIQYLLVREGSEEDLSLLTSQRFELMRHVGKWTWYKRQ